MASWSVGVSLRGKDGLSVLAGNGAPSPILGDVGQPGYIDVQNNRLYGPKTAQGWPATYVNLQATLPNNLQANSIILAPVSGETLATQITLKNSSGTTLFSVDATGALTGTSATLGSVTTSGAATVGGVLGVTGLASAGRFVANGPGSASAPMLAFTANGSGSSYTCGLFSDNIKSEMYEVVADRVARSVTFVGTTPANSDRTFITHSFYSGVAAASPAHRFYIAGGQLALQILGSADATFYGQLAVNGLATTAGLKLSSGVVTFADGTTQSTAGGAAATPATYAATSAGTAASPAFRLSTATNGAGLYFDGAQGNTLLSVNGYKSLYSTSATNAAAGASGWAIASTLGAGSALLALFGAASTTVPVASIDGAGALSVTSATIGGLAKAAGVTLTSGSVTFADGTSQTTAAANGSSATYAATSAGSAASPAFRYGPANNGAGLYFDGAQGNVSLSVNGYRGLYSTSAANAASGAHGFAIASTLGSGSTLLALFGSSSSTVPVASIDGAGALVAGPGTFSGLAKSAGLTLTSGALTFADGTSQSTAATSSGSGTSTVYGVLPQWGPSAYFPGIQVTASTDQKGYLPGTTTISTFTPQQDSALSGVQVQNFAATGATVTVGLYNATTATTVMTISAGSGTFQGPAYSTTQYPLVTGNSYVWYVSRSGGGIAYVTVSPLYYQPTTSLVGASSFPKWVTAASTALSTNGVLMQAEGFAPTQRTYFIYANTAYMRTVTCTLKGTGSASFVLSNGQAVLYTSPLMTASSAGNTITFGPFLSQATQGIVLTGGNSHYWYTMGSGGSCTAELSMTVLQ